MSRPRLAFECMHCGQDFVNDTGECPECGMLMSYEAVYDLALEVWVEQGK